MQKKHLKYVGFLTTLASVLLLVLFIYQTKINNQDEDLVFCSSLYANNSISKTVEIENKIKKDYNKVLKNDENQIVYNTPYSNKSDSKVTDLENKIKKIYDKVLRCTVAIDKGSGVIISKDGYVLTASHVISGALRKKSIITMHDGTKYTAVHLGRDEKTDYGLMKIVEEGNWEFLELGSSSNLVENEACLMFGHPQAYQSGRPAVMRLGFYQGLKPKVAETLKTSCIMMPGDSGGPLVDLNGKVIGVCSRIGFDSIDSNYYPSVDIVKKNFDKLVNGEIFNSRKANKKPKASIETKIKNTPVKQSVQFPSNDTDEHFSLEGGKKYLINSIAKSVKNINKSIVKLKSTIKNKEVITYGTIIHSKGYIVAKASEINKENITCELYEGTVIPAKSIGIDDANDLIVLQIKSKKLKAIKLPKTLNTNVGKIVGGASFKAGIKYSGIIGVNGRKIKKDPPPKKIIGAYVYSNNNEIFKIYRKSPADVAGLKLKDIIIKFDSTKVKTSKAYFDMLHKSKINQKVKITFLRNGKEEVTEVVIGEVPKGSTVVSKRKSDFTNVFTHDMPLETYETGTPVIDTYGNFIGVNIAKESRTCSFAIPTDVVLESVQKIIKDDKIKFPKLESL